MHLARISTAKKGFLKDMYVTNYVLADQQDQLTSYSDLKEDEYTGATKFALGLSRRYEWGRNWLWGTQQSYFLSQNGTEISRNNVMRSNQNFLSMKTMTTQMFCKNTLCL